MTPRSTEVPQHVRKQIGEAIWLLLALLRGTPPDWCGQTTAWVRQATPIADSEFAEIFGASTAVIARWRTVLRRAGLVGWLVAPKRGRVFWVSAVSHLFERSTEPPAQETQSQTAPRPQAPSSLVH